MGAVEVLTDPSSVYKADFEDKIDLVHTVRNALASVQTVRPCTNVASFLCLCVCVYMLMLFVLCFLIVTFLLLCHCQGDSDLYNELVGALHTKDFSDHDAVAQLEVCLVRPMKIIFFGFPC